ELVLRRVGLYNMLSLDVKRARENRVPRVAVVDDCDLMRASGLALRRRRTRIHEPVIDFEPVRGPVGPRQIKTKGLRILRIRHIVERHPAWTGCPAGGWFGLALFISCVPRRGFSCWG